jgi:hypothetical protein
MSELAKRIVAALMKDMDRAAGFVREDLTDFERGELEAVVDDALAPARDEDDARRFLWLNHGCPPAALKGDEGEMQCNAEDCHLDFKREPLDSLLITLFAQGRLIGEIPDAVPVSDLRSLVQRIRIATEASERRSAASEQKGDLRGAPGGQADASKQWANELAALCDAAEASHKDAAGEAHKSLRPASPA